MSPPHRLLKSARSLHLYLGVFTVPALLFFAFTGALQSFSLHETTRGSSYVPPAWLASMAQLHKKQTLVMPVRQSRPPEAEIAGRGPRADAQSATPAPSVTPIEGRAAPRSGATAAARAKPKNVLPMKIFFALMALSLFVSTLTGLYMAYRYSRKPRLVSLILLAGIIVPLLLLLL